jgi:hypothetical protein
MSKDYEFQNTNCFIKLIVKHLALFISRRHTLKIYFIKSISKHLATFIFKGRTLFISWQIWVLFVLLDVLDWRLQLQNLYEL